MSVLTHLSILLIIGSAVIITLASARAVTRLRSPAVIGYVLIGVILGKSFLSLITPDILERLDLINDLALGIIGFIIGGELNFSRLKALGKITIIIAIFESLGAFLVVFICSLLITGNVPYSLLLGAVSSATAPAATVTVINQYKARGPLTSVILGIVGSDDAIALIVYTFASAISYSLIIHRPLPLPIILLRSGIRLVSCIIIGAGLGLLLVYFLRKLKSKEEHFSLALGFLFICSGLAKQLHLPEILTIMIMAIVGGNLLPRRFTEVTSLFRTAGFPLIAIFFCFGGARLNIRLLPQIGLIGIVYLFARMAGKYLGAMLGAYLSSASEIIRRYVGLSLWPQIGVALAIAIMVEKNFGHLGPEGARFAESIMNILLFTTVFTEIIGPLATKFALTKAGEINTK